MIAEIFEFVIGFYNNIFVAVITVTSIIKKQKHTAKQDTVINIHKNV